MNKLKVAKKIVNYAINPLASMRNPIGNIRLVNRSKKEGVHYQDIRLDHVIPQDEVDKMDKRLKQLSFISFLCSISIVSIALVIFLVNKLDALAEAQLFVSILFAVLAFVISIKFGFLADGVRNNMSFQHKDPLTYFVKNGRSYFAWLFI